MYLSIATIFGYTSPESMLSGEASQNRFFKIGGFSNNFANFNINLFGYLGFIYLPSLLLVLYRFYDDSAYSFDKVRRTFAYITLFICALILQALIFNNGSFGVFIVESLRQYIGIFGISILVFLCVIVSLIIISKKRMLFILQYLMGAWNMFNKSFGKSIGNAFNKAFERLKEIYADFNMDYLQRANKKMLNLQYSETITMARSKYTFDCPLVEPPLDSFKDSIKVSSIMPLESTKDSEPSESNIRLILDSKNANKESKKLDYLQLKNNYNSNENLLKRFQKITSHQNTNFDFNDTANNITIRLKDSKNNNVLESFVSPKKTALKEEWLSNDINHTPKTNVEKSQNVILKKPSNLQNNPQNKILESKITAQINQIKKDSHISKTSENITPTITLKTPNQNSKDFITKLRENATTLVKPAKESSSQEVRKIPLESSYKTMDMSFTREVEIVEITQPNAAEIIESNLDSIKNNAESSLDSIKNNLENSCQLDIENTAPIEILDIPNLDLQSIESKSTDSINQANSVSNDFITPSHSPNNESVVRSLSANNESVMLHLNDTNADSIIITESANDNLDSKETHNPDSKKDSVMLSLCEAKAKHLNDTNIESNNQDSIIKLKPQITESTNDKKDVSPFATQKAQHDDNLDSIQITESISTITPPSPPAKGGATTHTDSMQITESTNDNLDSKETHNLDSKKDSVTPSLSVSNDSVMLSRNEVEAKHLNDTNTDSATFPPSANSVAFPSLSANAATFPPPLRGGQGGGIPADSKEIHNLDSIKDSVIPSLTVSDKSVMLSHNEVEAKHLNDTNTDSTNLDSKETTQNIESNTPQNPFNTNIAFNAPNYKANYEAKYPQTFGNYNAYDFISNMPNMPQTTQYNQVDSKETQNLDSKKDSVMLSEAKHLNDAIIESNNQDSIIKLKQQNTESTNNKKDVAPLQRLSHDDNSNSKEIQNLDSNKDFVMLSLSETKAKHLNNTNIESANLDSKETAQITESTNANLDTSLTLSMTNTPADSITPVIKLKQQNTESTITQYSPPSPPAKGGATTHADSMQITESTNDKKDVSPFSKAQHDDNSNSITITESTNDNLDSIQITESKSTIAPQSPSNDNTQDPPHYHLPPTFLLKQPQHIETIDDIEIDNKIENLLAKLRVFKINGDIVSIFTGPVVTTFEFRPEADVKVAKVLGLQDDLAMSLKARNIRIQAPIPGKDVIGIEIPNNIVETIYLRDILESSAFKESTEPLKIILGKDIVGAPVVENLAKLPHLLVAGTTGSGKSVGVNTLILSLLYTNSPDNLKLMMIDPKKVEFAPYEDLPHLITPVINSPQKAIKALQVATEEMYERYEKLKEMKTKNIISYNERANEKMPYFVIIIDELAELMATGGKEAEGAITQIAQMGRAAGMHLIIATQRSSVNVVTGTLKANLPARLSYRVGNMVDSKVVIDTSGAERLLGNGDGLFASPLGLKRIHSPWVSEREIDEIIAFIKAQREPNYDERFNADERVSAPSDAPSMQGDLIEQAKEIMRRDQKSTISHIQRKLNIGYNKAANIVESLEKEGFLSAPDTKGKREILG